MDVGVDVVVNAADWLNGFALPAISETSGLALTVSSSSSRFPWNFGAASLSVPVPMPAGERMCDGSVGKGVRE